MEQTSCSVDGRYRRYAVPNYYQIIAVIPRPAVKVFHEYFPEYKAKSEIIVTKGGFKRREIHMLLTLRNLTITVVHFMYNLTFSIQS